MRASCLILLLYLIPSCITDVLRKEICVPGYMVFAAIRIVLAVIYVDPILISDLCTAAMIGILMLIPGAHGIIGGGDLISMATVGLCIGLYNVPVFFTILALCSAVMAAIMTYKKIPLKEQVPMLPTITVAYVGTLLLIGIHK